MAVFAVGLLFAPGLAYVLGVRGEPIENRSSRPLPGSSSGWNVFGDFGDFVADRLTLRKEAVEADAWIDENMFDEDPAFGGGATARVIRGDDGFLFLADAIDTACSPHAPVAETVANLDRLATIIERSGREMVAMVAPDKSTVHPQLLPDDLATFDCFEQYTEDLWTSLSAADIPGYHDLRALLQRESSTTREPLYLRKDSHWDSRGSLAMVQMLVDSLAPGLWNPDDVEYIGLGAYTGDLTGMQGNPEVDQAPMYALSRESVVAEETEVLDDIEGGPNRRFKNNGPEGRLISGRSVLFLDSFGLVALPQLVPYFEDLTVIRLVDFPTESERFISLIGESDRVIVLTVERGASYRLSFEIGAPEFLDRLESGLSR